MQRRVNQKSKIQNLKCPAASYKLYHFQPVSSMDGRLSPSPARDDFEVALHSHPVGRQLQPVDEGRERQTVRYFPRLAVQLNRYQRASGHLRLGPRVTIPTLISYCGWRQSPWLFGGKPSDSSAAHDAIVAQPEPRMRSGSLLSRSTRRQGTAAARAGTVRQERNRA